MCQFQNRNTQNLPRHPADKTGYPPKTLPWTDKFCHFVRFEMAERQGLRAKGRNGNFWQGHIGVLFPSPLGPQPSALSPQPLALSLSIPSVVSCGPGLALRSLRARDVVLWYLIWYCPSILGILVATLLS